MNCYSDSCELYLDLFEAQNSNIGLTDGRPILFASDVALPFARGGSDFPSDQQWTCFQFRRRILSVSAPLLRTANNLNHIFLLL